MFYLSEFFLLRPHSSTSRALYTYSVLLIKSVMYANAVQDHMNIVSFPDIDAMRVNMKQAMRVRGVL